VKWSFPAGQATFNPATFPETTSTLTEGKLHSKCELSQEKLSKVIAEEQPIRALSLGPGVLRFGCGGEAPSTRGLARLAKRYVPESSTVGCQMRSDQA